jgi:CheY-like chemotaxis protein
MMLICGTIPKKDFLLTLGEARQDGEYLFINNQSIPCFQGTTALTAAACTTLSYLGHAPPQALLAGDIGDGAGSRKIYDFLTKNLPDLNADILLMHYMLPIMGLMRKVCGAARKCPRKPVMMADASAMYAAKAAGLAAQFDIFTPDPSELAFLADPDATHPAYMSRYLFEADINQAPELIAASYRNQSAAKMLVIKGSTDYIVMEGKIVATVSQPNVPALEAIGGTGDTISGMIGAFIKGGLPWTKAAIFAAKANRMAGKYAGATPATKIKEIIAVLPAVFKDCLDE